MQGELYGSNRFRINRVVAEVSREVSRMELEVVERWKCG